MPYSWGGFSSLEEFDRGVAEGRCAGHLPSDERDPASAWAVGVDCSGYLSRCWDLPTEQSTRSLGWLCYELADYSELLPGDLINSYDSHAVLFVDFADDSHVRVFEAGFPKVHEEIYALEALRAESMRPLRYKPLDARWVHLERAAPLFEASPEASALGHFEVGDATDALPAAPLADAQLGEWARWRSVGDAGGASFVHQVARRAPEIEVQIAVEAGGRSMETSEPRSPSFSALELLEGFAPVGQRMSESHIEETSRERGRWIVGDRTFPAWRTRARIEGAFVVRHQRTSVSIEVLLVHSEEVPAEGVLRVELRVHYGLERNSVDSEAIYELVAFGTAG